MSDPWAFGWSQALTITGFLLTGLIAIGGFRSFGRWKREKIEEKRIDVAIEALVLMHEADLIFESIRAPMVNEFEWSTMPEFPGDTEAKRRLWGTFYAVLMRVKREKDFFDRALKVQIRCAALFGAETGAAVLLIQRARRDVEVAADMLTRDPDPTPLREENREFQENLRDIVWGGQAVALHRPDEVENKLRAFREHVERVCRPVVDKGFGKSNRTGIGRLLDWLGL
jgi:hypothetical protein